MSALSIHLINLPRSTARRADMQARLAVLGLDYDVFEAVDGRADWDRLTASVDLTAFRRNVGREVLPGEIGAYHSHLGVWQRFLDGPKSVALVLEDDVVFHDDFKAALEVALEHVTAWDFLMLNKIRAKHPVRQARLGAYDLNAYIGPATGLGAYLITRDLAQRLLPGMLPITRPIDHELDRTHIHDFRHFGLEPFPSHVSDGNESTITGTGFAEVKKYPAWRRLPTYGLRFSNLLGKARHMWRRGMF